MRPRFKRSICKAIPDVLGRLGILSFWGTVSSTLRKMLYLTWTRSRSLGVACLPPKEWGLYVFRGSRERWFGVPGGGGGFGYTLPSKLTDKRCISGFVLPGTECVTINHKALTTRVNIMEGIHVVAATLWANQGRFITLTNIHTGNWLERGNTPLELFGMLCPLISILFLPIFPKNIKKKNPHQNL